jgi:RNA processing factor Prp31
MKNELKKELEKRISEIKELYPKPPKRAEKPKEIRKGGRRRKRRPHRGKAK